MPQGLLGPWGGAPPPPWAPASGPQSAAIWSDAVARCDRQSLMQAPVLQSPPPFGHMQSTSSRPASPPRSPPHSVRDFAGSVSAPSVSPGGHWGGVPMAIQQGGAPMVTESVSPVLGQLAATIEHRKQACGGSLMQQLEMEGARINEINWAQKEMIRQRAQEQRDIIDKQAEAAMFNLDRRRNEQVMGLHHDVFNQRSHLEQEAAKAAVDCYMQFERASPDTRTPARRQFTEHEPLAPTDSRPPPPPRPVGHQAPPAFAMHSREASRGYPELGGQPSWIGLNTQHFHPQVPPRGMHLQPFPSLAMPPMGPPHGIAMQRPPSHTFSQMPLHLPVQQQMPLQLLSPLPGTPSQHSACVATEAWEAAHAACAAWQRLPPPRPAGPSTAFSSSPFSPRIVSPPGTPRPDGLTAFGNSVQVIAEEEEDTVDEYGRLSKRRVFSISGMDGEPLAIVQMLN